MKKLYYYPFYTFYKLAEKTSVFTAKFAAELSILILQIWFIISIGIYIQIFTDYRIIPSHPLNLTTIIGTIILISLNWFLVDYNNRWSIEFSRIEDKKGFQKMRIYIIGICIILFVIISIISAFYLLNAVRKGYIII